MALTGRGVSCMGMCVLIIPRYKFPVLTTMPTGTAWRNGYGYAYMDSNSMKSGLAPAAPHNTSSLQDSAMALTYTLDQVIANRR